MTQLNSWTIRPRRPYISYMVKLSLTAIPEGVPYDQTEVEHEFELDTSDDVLRFLGLQVARGKLAGNDMSVLVFSTLAEKIVNGHRYGHHHFTIGDYIPQIVEWYLRETLSDQSNITHDDTHLVN